MKTLALFLPNWIGDVVMATPAIRAVRERYPTAKLLAVCRPYVAATLEGGTWFDEVIAFDKKGPRERREVAVIRRLRKERVEAAVLFSNSFRSALVAALGRCRRRIGFNRYGRGFLLTDRLQPKCVAGQYVPTPIINDYNRLVMPLDISSPGHRMELFTTPNDEQAADHLWHELGLSRYSEVIGLNSSGAFGAAKLWPTEYFAELARTLADQRGSGVLVVCGPNERAIARAIVEQAGRANVVSLADHPVSLGLTKACVRRCSALVTTDSGPRHFAAAFDRPVVALFGPTFIEWTQTYFAKEITLQKKVPCGPCQLRVCPFDHRCMRELTVAEVLAATTDLLTRFPTRSDRYAG